MSAPRRERRRGAPRRAAILPAAAVIASGLITGLATGNAYGSARTTHDPTCDRGMSCFWTETGYRGRLTTHDLRETNPGDCNPLPQGVPARSLANRSDRALSVYTDSNCDTDKPHTTYPGSGTFAPDVPIYVAAFKIAE